MNQARRSIKLRDALHEFNVQLARDQRFDQLILPLRDGLTWVQPASSLGKSSATPSVPSMGPLAEYLTLVSSAEPHRFEDLRKHTAALGPEYQKSVLGAHSGRLLHMLVRLARPARVLEVGGFTGYATLWMALGLPTAGQLLSLEREERCATIAARQLDNAGIGDRVEIRTGDPSATLMSLSTDDHDSYDLAVWHVEDNHAASAGEQSVLLRSLLKLLAPHGVLVAVQRSSDTHDISGSRTLFDAEQTFLKDSPFSVVTVPSPDGDERLMTIVCSEV